MVFGIVSWKYIIDFINSKSYDLLSFLIYYKLNQNVIYTNELQTTNSIQNPTDFVLFIKFVCYQVKLCQTHGKQTLVH